MTLRTNRIETSNGSQAVDTQYVVHGSSKAWVAYDQSPGLTVLDSLNVSSVTDSATGAARISYASNFSNANYCATSTASPSNGNAGIALLNLYSGSKQTGSADIWTTNQSATLADSADVAFSFQGDLA